MHFLCIFVISSTSTKTLVPLFTKKQSFCHCLRVSVYLGSRGQQNWSEVWGWASGQAHLLNIGLFPTHWSCSRSVFDSHLSKMSVCHEPWGWPQILGNLNYLIFKHQWLAFTKPPFNLGKGAGWQPEKTLHRVNFLGSWCPLYVEVLTDWDGSPLKMDYIQLYPCVLKPRHTECNGSSPPRFQVIFRVTGFLWFRTEVVPRLVLKVQ